MRNIDFYKLLEEATYFKNCMTFLNSVQPQDRIQEIISKNILIRLTNHYEDILKKNLLKSKSKLKFLL